MKKHLAVAILLGAISAQAAINNVSAGSPVSGTGVSFVSAAITESTCSSACSRSQTITVPTGFTSYGIMMSYFNLSFLDSAGGKLKKAKLVLAATSYNPGTGQLDFDLSVDLQGNPAPSNKTFTFNVWFVVLLGNDTDVKAKQFAATSFSGNGAMGECDTTGSCYDVTTMTGAGATNVPFRRMFLRGFDVSTVSTAGFFLSDVLLSSTAYGPSGNNANGASECLFGGSSTENLSCSLYLMSLAYKTAALYPVVKTDSVTAANGTVANGATINSPSPATAVGFSIGVQKLQATPDSAMTLKRMGGGCGGGFFATTPGTGQVTLTNLNHGLIDPAGTVNYDGSLQCIYTFVP